MIHELKTDYKYFKETLGGNKTFECRYNDRDFQVGDTVILKEWYDGTGYSGREIRGEITYILEKFAGLGEGWVVFSLKFKENEKRTASSNTSSCYYVKNPVLERSNTNDGKYVCKAWRCPGCGEVYNINTQYTNCPRCGQRVRWDGLRII